MLFMKMQEEQPSIITEIMTQLLLKAGLKEWVKTPLRCAFRDEATSFQKYVQTNAFEKNGRHSKDKYIIILHVPEAKERWKIQGTNNGWWK